MTDRIEPALSASEWASLADVDPDIMSGEPLTGIGIGYTNGDFRTGSLHNPFSPTQLIALANAALPDDDSRKITRSWIDTIVVAVERLSDTNCDPSIWERLDAIGAALQSYLPPE